MAKRQGIAWSEVENVLVFHDHTPLCLGERVAIMVVMCVCVALDRDNCYLW